MGFEPTTFRDLADALAIELLPSQVAQCSTCLTVFVEMLV